MQAGHGIPSKWKFSPTCFAVASEQQTLVLKGIKAHTVGQARSASVKPSISRWTCLRSSIPHPFSWTLVRASA